MNAAKSNALRGQLTDKFVGRAGIHGIGIRVQDDEPVVYVYVNHGQPSQEQVLKDITAEARPYSVVLVIDKIPSTREDSIPSRNGTAKTLQF